MGFFDFFSNNAETAEQHQVVRASCVHHGQLRGADARVPLLREGCC